MQNIHVHKLYLKPICSEKFDENEWIILQTEHINYDDINP
jgi:hypothetical protein